MKNSLVKNILKYTLTSILIAGSLVSCADTEYLKDRQILDNYKRTDIRVVKENDKYLKFAYELQKNCVKFKDVRADYAAEKLREINNGRELFAGDVINVPVDGSYEGCWNK